MFFGLIVFLVILLVAVAAWDSYIVIDPAEFGLRIRLGGRVPIRSGGVIYEGFHLKLPFVERIETYSMELIDKDVSFTFTTKDELQLQVKGSFQYRLDPEVADQENRPVVAAVSEETMFNGIKEAVQARLTGLGGSIGHQIFIDQRQSLGDVINAILRLENPPHITHQHGAPGPDALTGRWDPRRRWCGKTDCGFAGDIDAKDLIGFYTFHWPQIRILLKSEKDLRESRSDIEKRYGLDVDSFALGDTTFTEETRKAMEKKKQTEAAAGAVTTRLRLAKDVQSTLEGATAQEAIDFVDVSLDPKVSKHVVSVQGQAGVLGAVLAGFAGGGGKTSSAAPAGSGGGGKRKGDKK